MSTTADAAPLRILLVGEGRSPIHEDAWQRGLEAAGCVVRRFNWLSRFQSISPLSSILLRMQNQLLAGPTLQELNDDLVAQILARPPDAVILYRPTHIFAKALRIIRSKAPSTLLVSYNNDDPFSPKAPKHLWRHYLDGIPLVDVALAYRTKNLAELQAAGARRTYLLRSYYLPYVHRPVELTESDRHRYQADVTFVGHYEPDGRIDYLAAAAEAVAGLRLFGPDWDCAPSHPGLQRFLPIQPLSPPEYVKAIQCAKIALVFFSGLNNDSYTRRVFEIPAIGTFMLSQRTADMEGLFRPGIEAAYFTSADELVEQARRYLADDQGRDEIAAAGAARVREAGHDVFSRMRELTTLIKEWRARP
jgi:spore maturation protein CgeB